MVDYEVWAVLEKLTIIEELSILKSSFAKRDDCVSETLVFYRKTFWKIEMKHYYFLKTIAFLCKISANSYAAAFKNEESFLQFHPELS